MRTYDERLENIRAKAKVNRKARRILTTSVVCLSMLALLVGSVILWPELLFGVSYGPTMSPALQHPTLDDAPSDTLPPWFTRPNQFAPMDTVPAEPPVTTLPIIPTLPTEPPLYAMGNIPFKTQTVYYGAIDMQPQEGHVDVIRSTTELKSYLSVLEQDLFEKTTKYDDRFFENHTLLALWNIRGSSSVVYEVTEVCMFLYGHVYISGETYQPDAENDDTMCWLIFIEAQADIPHNAKITVDYTTIEKEQTYDPHQWLERMSEDVQSRICQDYIDQFYADCDWAKEVDMSLRVFGILDNAYAVFVDGFFHAEVETVESVCGLQFRYPSLQALYIYSDGCFYSLQEAYDAQLVIFEEICLIYKNYTLAYPMYY